MTITKTKPPSDAQARRLALYWAKNGDINIGKDFVEPTDAVLIRNGWITPTGAAGFFSGGRAEFSVYRFGQAGSDALATYFINKR